MNSLVLGFFYLTAMAWALCEVCLIAGTGNWLPLSLFLVLFFVAFSILGCLNVSDGMMNMFGAATAILLGLFLLFISFAGFQISPAVGLLKLFGALSIVAAGIIPFLPAKKNDSHSH
ncbi:MAG: hypothetical protein HKN23_00240 [Verrucomicrobiales bacterium]|nr:hypothetical protein [Verrucomicrobiales bacterium]